MQLATATSMADTTVVPDVTRSANRYPANPASALTARLGVRVRSDSATPVAAKPTVANWPHGTPWSNSCVLTVTVLTTTTSAIASSISHTRLGMRGSHHRRPAGRSGATGSRTDISTVISNNCPARKWRIDHDLTVSVRPRGGMRPRYRMRPTQPGLLSQDHRHPRRSVPSAQHLGNGGHLVPQTPA